MVEKEQAIQQIVFSPLERKKNKIDIYLSPYSKVNSI